MPLVYDDFGLGAPDGATRALLRQLPTTGVFVTDRDYRVVLCEGGAFRAAGWDPETVEGRRLPDLLPAETWARLEPYYAKALAGAPQGFRTTPPGGSTFKVLASPVIDPVDGAVEGLFVVMIDATLEVDAEERRRAEALRLSEERFGLVFHQASVGMLVVHLAGEDPGAVIEANEAFGQLVGRSPQELIGQNIRSFTHPEDVEQDLLSMAPLVSGRVDHYVRTKRYLRPSGEERIVRLRASAVRDAGGRPLYGLGIVIDVTEQVMAQEARTGIVESVFEGIVAVDVEGRIMVFNRAAEEMFGCSRESVLGRPALDALVPPELRRRFAARMEEMRAAARESTVAEHQEAILLHASGARFPAEISVRRTGREPVEFTAFVRDLSEERRAERRRRGAEDLFRSLFESSAVAMAVLNLQGRCLEANPEMCRFLGRTQEELRACTVDDVTHPDDRMPTPDLVVALEEHGAVRREKRFVRPDGQVVWGFAHTTLLRDDQGRPRGAQAQVVDITAQRQANDRLGAVLESIAEGVFAIDGEGRVEKVNPAAQRMLGYREDQVVGRLMHETVHDHTGPSEDCPIVQVAGTGEPVRVEDDTFWRADGTLLPVSYSAAPLGTGDERGVVVVFSDISERKAREQGLQRRLAALDRLEETRVALREDRLVLYSQPILDISLGEVVQEEVLLRMVAPDGTIVTPDEFLPVAEEYGLIQDIDHWVICESAKLAAQGRHVEVNVSAKTLGNRDLTQWVEDAISAAGADPRLMTFEITETALTNDLDQARRFAERIAALGCGFALDDFGTGYGSFTLLKRLPISFLKIDIEFVRNLLSDQADGHVVRAVVNLAKGLGQKTIAEGVEDEETLAALAAMGVDYAQGYFIGRPSPVVSAQ